MSTTAWVSLRRPRRPDETLVGRRAATALVTLLLVALTSGGVLLAHTIREREQSRVAGHLGVALQAALSEAAQEASQAQQQAAALAGDAELQRALAGDDARVLARITGAVPGASAVPGSGDVPGTTRPAIRREVRVLSGRPARRNGRDHDPARRRLPGPAALGGAARAGRRVPLPPGRQDRRKRVHGRGRAVLPHATTARPAGQNYQVVQTRLLGGPRGVRLAAFAPAAEAGTPIARAERLLAACLAATFAALLLLARLSPAPCSACSHNSPGRHEARRPTT